MGKSGEEREGVLEGTVEDEGQVWGKGKMRCFGEKINKVTCVEAEGEKGDRLLITCVNSILPDKLGEERTNERMNEERKARKKEETKEG